MLAAGFEPGSSRSKADSLTSRPSCYAMVSGETGPLVAVDPSAQPTPSPLGPPRQVSVLFSTTSATAAWQTPAPPLLTGEGAWQKWKYEVHIMDGRKMIYHKNISSTRYDVSHLRPNTFYTFKVRAYSSSGAGPWSDPFHGRTLRQQRASPRLLLLTDDGVVSTDMSGHNTSLVASKYFLQEKFDGWQFSDMVVRGDLLVLASVNASNCGVLNLTNLEAKVLEDTKGVATVAIDALTQRVFWANPHLHLIGWNSLKGKNRATLSLMTGATRLEVDSRHGRLFWATSHAVYYSTLLGRGSTALHREQLFSGRQVTGLIVDEVGERAFWAVRDGSEGALYCASFGRKSGVTVHQPRPLPHPLSVGPAAYLNERLFFVSKEGNILISDTDLNSTAVLPLQHVKVQHVRIFNDESLNFLDEEVEVLPEAVDTSSVTSEGTWEDFVLTWKPVTNVNFTDVTYEVITEVLLDPNEVGEDEASSLRFVAFPMEPRVTIPWTPTRPFVPLRLSVRGVTSWGAGPRSVATLHSPPSLPGVPRALRYFLTPAPHAGGQEGDTSVLLRWLPPLQANGLVEQYELELCTGSLLSNCSRHFVPGEQLQLLLHTHVLQDFIFKVAAATSVGFGEMSAGVLIKASEHKPLPRLLAASPSQVELIDVDLSSGKTSWKRSLHAEGRPGAANIGVLLRNMTAYVQDAGNDIRMISLLSNETKIVTTLQEVALAMDVDFIAEKLLWLQRSRRPFYERGLSPFSDPHMSLITSGHQYHPPPPNALALRSFDLNFGTTEVVTTLRVNGSVTDLVTVPLHNESCSCRNKVILSGGVVYDPLTSEVLLATSASNHQRQSQKSGVTQRRPNPPKIVSSSPGIISADANACKCSMITSIDSLDGEGCSSLTVDSLHIYCYVGFSHDLLWFPRDSLGDKNTFLRALPLQQQHPLYISALDLATQSQPGTECLEGQESASLWIEDAGANSAVVHIIPPPPAPGCSHLSPLGYSYTLLYRPEQNSGLLSCQHDPNSCSQLVADAKTVTVAGLLAFTAYAIQVAAITALAQRTGLKPSYSPMTSFTTRAQPPPAAQLLEARSVDPESVEVTFLATPGLPYKLFWQLNHTIEGASRQPSDQHLLSGNVTQVTDSIDGLRPGAEYLIWVRIISAMDASVFVDSSAVEVMTLPPLPNIELCNASARSLSVAWTAPADFSILRHAVDFLSPGDGSIWSSKPSEQTTPGHTYSYAILDLLPAQHYLFRLRVTYNSSGYHKYIWPGSPLFNFSTLDAVPGEPGNVRLQQTGGDGGEWRVWWAPAADHGSAVTLYELQAAPLPLGAGDLLFTSVYNGTANRWPVSDLDPSGVYVFRVRAVNEVGVGLWSAHSTLEMAAHPKMLSSVNLPTILAAAIPATLLIFLLLFTLLACGKFLLLFSLLMCGEFLLLFSLLMRGELLLLFTLLACGELLLLFTLLACALQRSYNSSVKLKGAALSSSLTHTSRELELATLHHLPSNNNFVSEDNILYNLQNFSEEDIDLPRVSQHNVTREKFLGSGAFGEVFEGRTSGITGLPPGGKVAIKMLRKGATETEKCEFLKEAQLMSHFQHEHILRLLAICDDHDPFFLVLELMEGGDLLSHLRSNRAANGGRGLSLEELATMCVDVARGCQYLEELHFVHRDLAARNCLVSSADPRSRIVKIGDFGLARDIYKNDYYRKEGEGMLPVRWMSPESLTDGVFTSHSDVWAFGVLLWEIMTLGQQPYPARTNLEVMHYVRAGGRLSLPPNCPLQVEALMEKCWNFSPEERPRFRECLTVLLAVQQSLPRPPLAVHNANYVSNSDLSGLDNFAYSSEHEVNAPILSEACTDFNEVRHSIFSIPTTAEISDAAEDSPYGDYHGGCNSGASTVPLSMPLCGRQAHSSTFTDDTSSCNYPVSLNSGGVCTADIELSPVSEVSTDVSIVSNTLTTDTSSSTLRRTSPTRLQSPPSESRFNFGSNLSNLRSEPLPSSNSNSSIPSPFLLSLLQHFPENNFTRTLSLRLPRKSSPGPITDSPTSIAFTFNLPSSTGEHYVRPVSGRSCSEQPSAPISPPTTPELLSLGISRNEENSRVANTQDSSCSYVNQLVTTDDSYTPPQSNKSTPENCLSFMKSMAHYKRSSSFEAVNSTDKSYVDMSPNKAINIPGISPVRTSLKPLKEHMCSLSELRRSESSIDTLGYHRMKSPLSWSRLSGLSALSGMSGLTAEASTFHLDFVPSQSSC
ncbi:Fibronectin type III [Trinorchestia longiramus]|nr:Fibronectin type III [Trinorchestia longiramus]